MRVDLVAFLDLRAALGALDLDLVQVGVVTQRAVVREEHLDEGGDSAGRRAVDQVVVFDEEVVADVVRGQIAAGDDDRSGDRGDLVAAQ